MSAQETLQNEKNSINNTDKMTFLFKEVIQC